MINFNNATYVYSAGISSQLQKSDKPEIVFSGRSNVGKSSLINRLTNRKNLARVSSTPGKTATINFFDLPDFTLVDLPGYGYAKVSDNEKKRGAELVEGYFAEERKLCLVVQICDMRHKPSKDDFNMIDFLYNNGVPFVIVLTKTDKLNKTQYETRVNELMTELEDYQGTMLYPFSALSGEGIEEIKEVIDNKVTEYLKAQ